MRPMLMKRLTLLLVAVTCSAAHATPDGFDPTFASGAGALRFRGAHGYDAGSAIAQQVDGRYVIAGTSSPGNYNPNEGTVTRLNSDGSRDGTFGDGGVARVELGSGRFTCVAVQGDGKILAAGAYDFDMAVVRFRSDGVLDSTFAGDGVLVVTGWGNSFFNAIQLQADGGIVLAGGSGALNPTMTVVRLLANGTLDPSWDGDGVRVVTQFPFSRAYALAPMSGGTILVAGESSAVLSTEPQIALARLTSAGALDPTFDGDGLVTTTVGLSSYAKSIALQTSNVNPTRIVVAGSARFGMTGWDVLLVRYTDTGALDATFDGDGIVSTAMQTAGVADAAVTVRVIFSGGNASRLLVAGNESSGSSPGGSGFVNKYLLSGALDTAFDGDGKLPLSTFGTAPTLSGMLAINGRVITVGSGTRSDRQYESDIAVCRRLASDGSADTTFDHDGWVLDDSAVSTGTAAALAVQADGRLLVAGSGSGAGDTPMLRRFLVEGRPDSSFFATGLVDVISGYGDRTRLHGVAIGSDARIAVVGTVKPSVVVGLVAKRLANGAPDSSFAGKGWTTFSLGYNDSLLAVVVQPDGKVVAAGVSWDAQGNSAALVVRFRTDGTLDPAFGPGATGYVRIFANLSRTSASALALQPDGRLLLAVRGRLAANAPMQAVAMRLLANGAVDPSFGGFGQISAPLGIATANPTGIALGPAGRVVLAGWCSSGGGSPFAARWSADGVPDSTFDGDGLVVVPPRGGAEEVYALAVRPGGQLLFAGTTRLNSARSVATLTRLTPTGALDTSFAPQGRLDVSFVPDWGEAANAIVFDAQARAVVAGSSRDFPTLFRLAPESLPLAVDDEQRSPSAGLRFRPPVPNPTPAGCAFTLDLPVDGLADVCVLDVTGRRVRVLHAGTLAAGPRIFRWDGRDGTGKLLPAGQYFARARQQGAQAVVRVTLVR